MADKQETAQAAAARAPLKITLTAFAVGLGWAAWHAPQNMTQLQLTPSCLVWLVDSATAALVALSALELLMAVLGSALRAVQMRLQAMRH